MTNIDWTKVITQPLGIAGFALSLVSGLAGSLIKASPKGRIHWIVPGTFSLAVVCIAGGFWLYYHHEVAAERDAARREAADQRSKTADREVDSAGPPFCRNWNPETKVCHGCEFRIDQKGLPPNGKLPLFVCQKMVSGKHVYAEFVGGIGTDSPQVPSFTDVAISLQGKPSVYRAGTKNAGRPILSGDLTNEESIKDGESKLALQLGECQFGQGVADTCWVDGILSVVEEGFHLR